MKKATLLTLLLFTTCVWQLQAQCEAVNTAFKSGETLTYNLYFNWKFIWYKVGTAYMTTTSTQSKGQKAFRTRLVSRTNHQADHFFIMRDTLTATYTENLVPLEFRKAAEEGSRYTIDESWFSYENGRCIANQSRTFPRRGDVYKTRQSSSECIYDMLSILARARSFKDNEFKKGDKIHFPMTTGEETEVQTLIYRGKENFKAENGITYRCLKFSLVEYDDKKKEKEVITFFITDDPNHLPIRLDLYLRFGSAKAFLINVKGNRHPISSILKKQ